MWAYIIRRLLLIIPTMFLVTIIVFLTVRLIPGDVIELMVIEAGPEGAHQEAGEDPEVGKEAMRHKLGLDLPVHVQYGRWIGNAILHGDLGKSLWTGYPVTEALKLRFPVSGELSLLALVVTILIALPIGVYSGIRQDTGGDYLARSFAIVCIALPSFWLGIMVMVFPSVWWQWAPPMRFIPFIENPIENLAQFIIPAIILGMFFVGITMRMTRTMMLEVLRQDYIRTAWSKGLMERTIVFRHALRNALIPVVTLVGISLPLMVGGSVIMELIFCLPGVGSLLLEALSQRDYTVVSGVNLAIASFVLVVNLATDLTYGFLDPRVRYE